jgi:amino acid transporter
MSSESSIKTSPVYPSVGTLGTVGVCVVAFASIAGGPYGIEVAVGVAGALPTLLGLVATALIWSAPQALVTAELSSTFPSNAGYVAWVLHGLGPVAGFVNAWSMIIAQSLNIPLYPVLIADYMLQIIPTLSDGDLWAIKLSCMIFAVILNIRGVQAVETASLIMVLLVQTPFIIMPFMFASKYGGDKFAWKELGKSDLDLAGGEFSVFASTLCWNMQGWVTLGSLAAEVKNVKRNYPIGLLIAVTLVAINYLYPVLVGIAMSPDPSVWETGYFVTLAQSINPNLGTYALVMAAFSSMSNLVPQLTTSARALCAAARLGIVPIPLLAKAHVTQFKTPVPAIIAVAIISSVCMAFDFNILVVIQLLFSGVGLALQFAAFLRLKHYEPKLVRPYEVPYGIIGAWLICIPFFALLGLVAISAAIETPSLAGAAAGMSLILIAGGYAWVRYSIGNDAILLLGKGEDENENDKNDGVSDRDGQLIDGERVNEPLLHSSSGGGGGGGGGKG